MTIAETPSHAPVADGIQAAGRVHITYTWDRRRIRHVVIDPDRLK